MDTNATNPAPPSPVWTQFYRGRRVFVTGHTGFKGSWLCEWLLALGADVTGFSLEPDTDPSLFRQLGLERRLHHHIGDIRDPRPLARALSEARPDAIFHLAAQPLVRRSYADPAGTHEVNFLGTVRLLEALRTANRPCAAVMVTSDKCYENIGTLRGYRENDRLGGHDPYSSSKACAELAVSSYRRSFFGGEDDRPGPVRVASARAGNVIGGGDWAADRIVPDCIRSLDANEPVPIRNKTSVRPWQHVLEPLAGYLMLGARIHPDMDDGQTGLHRAMDAFNFGPGSTSERTVKELVEEILLHWPGRWIDRAPAFAPHEASVLTLDVTKAARLLGWRPRWNFAKTVEKTVSWYRSALRESGATVRAMTRDQIECYTKDSTALDPNASAPKKQISRPVRNRKERAVATR